MLEMQAVARVYRHRGGAVAALDGISLTISSGEFLSIVGSSGSGKSTLLLMLGAMLSPSRGRVLMESKSVYDIPPGQRARLRRDRIGFLFQTFNLVPYLTACENVQVPLLLAGVSESEQMRRAADLLTKVGLENRLQHKPGELSVGQQQRVALARMLANDPQIILADEPTGNLDPATSDEVMDFLLELNREGRTIVMVTHDPHAAKKAARTIVLQEGRIRA